jgi:hypothetical protein
MPHEGFDGRPADNLLSHETIPIPLKISEHVEDLTFDIAKLAHYPVILGMGWLDLHDPHVHWTSRRIVFDSNYCVENCLSTLHSVQSLEQHPQSAILIDSLPVAEISGVKSTAVPNQTTPSRPRHPPSQTTSRLAAAPVQIERFPSMPSTPLPPVRISLVSASAFRLSMKQGDAFQLTVSDLRGLNDTSPTPIHVFSAFSAVTKTDETPTPPTTTDPSVLVPSEYHDFLDVFDKKPTEILPPRSSYDHQIPITPNTDIPMSRLYPLSASKLKSLADYLQDNLKKGHIRPSSSPAAAPILFVKKKDGSLRLCVDYRALNSVTIKNRYPLPLISETLDRLSTAKHFTKIDLHVAYAQVRITDRDEWKTAFRTRYSHFEYLVMPFGLTNAPASFQNLVNDVLQEFLDLFVIVYLDDILIFSDNPSEHRKHVRLVLAKLRTANLYAKAEKCEFDRDKVEFLGYRVGVNGISMDNSKLDSIQDWPVPRSVKEVQSFLGFANFYRRFILGYSKIAHPLTQLTKKDVPFVFSDDTRAAFQTLKDAFTTAPVLSHHQPGIQCVLETDASDYAIGAVVSQRQGKHLHPIVFFSRKLTPVELNYEIHDKELLAVVDGFKQFRQYLEGVNEPTLVYTDHKNLEYFFSVRVLSRRQARWYELLTSYNYSLAYRPGSQQGKLDTLSRRPDYAVDSKASDSKPILFFDPKVVDPAVVASL